MADRPKLDLRSFDRWLASLIVVLAIGLAAGLGIGYAKKSRYAFCQGEAENHPAQRDLSDLGAAGFLWLPTAEFESLGRSEGAISIYFREGAGASSRAVRLEKGEAEIELISDLETAAIFSVRPLREASQCRSRSGELELIWPERSLLAWMVPALRGDRI